MDERIKQLINTSAHKMADLGYYMAHTEQDEKGWISIPPELSWSGNEEQLNLTDTKRMAQFVYLLDAKQRFENGLAIHEMSPRAPSDNSLFDEAATRANLADVNQRMDDLLTEMRATN